MRGGAGSFLCLGIFFIHLRLRLRVLRASTAREVWLVVRASSVTTYFFLPGIYSWAAAGWAGLLGWLPHAAGVIGLVDKRKGRGRW
jgi:hypothetical protein